MEYYIARLISVESMVNTFVILGYENTGRFHINIVGMFIDDILVMLSDLGWIMTGFSYFPENEKSTVRVWYFQKPKD
jgi:hypothetical protein